MLVHKVTAVLRRSGFQPQYADRRGLRPGYQVAVLGDQVGVLCGTRYPVSQVRAVLEEAGLLVREREGAAPDALFVFGRR